MTSAIQVLRHSTHEHHAALERAPLARDLMLPQLTVPRYIEILGVWSHAWAALEQCIWASPLASEVSALLPPRRAQAAQDDLLFWRQRGYSVPAPAAKPHALLDALRPAQVPGLLGVCYVAQGASLGAKVISAHLKKVLPLAGAQGSSFFAGEGQPSLSWPQWSKGLDVQLAEPDAVAQAVVWANATFIALQDAFAGAPAQELAGTT